MTDSRKVKLLYCSPADASVGMLKYCEEIEAEIFPHKIFFYPINLTKNSLFDEFNIKLANNNLITASDTEIEKTLLPFLRDTLYDTLETEHTIQKRNSQKANERTQQMLRDLELMPHEEQERTLRKQFKPKERESIKKILHNRRRKQLNDAVEELL